ncbi:hypothetical protein FAI41_00840 [Acetobacteraceae bacterium]|nr:hypothetical protein FAI41_00840 [Acetobacteraceae bacterium]
MAVKKIRGYFSFLLVIFASLTLCAWVVSFGLWSSYSRYESKLEKHRSARHFQTQSQAPPPKVLGDSFWKQFEIVSEVHLEGWQHGINDFAGQVDYSLPAIMSLSEQVKLRWEVMPLRAEGVGQAIALRLHKDFFSCPAAKETPLLMWFNNGQSVPFAIEKCGKNFHKFGTNPTESIKLSGTLAVGALPVLISEGKRAVRLYFDSNHKSEEILLWYQKVSSAKTDPALLANIQGWYIQATALNQDSLDNVEWGKAPVEVTNFFPFA